jgi:O-methyltransferase
MSLFDKVLTGKLNRPFLSPKLRQDLMNARGNLNQEYPNDFTAEEKQDIGISRPLTMTSPERLVSLSRAVDYLVGQGIGGDIVECGVWRGGSMLLVAMKLARLDDTKRNLYLFDTFEGMSEPGREDVSNSDQKTAKELLDAAERTAGNNVWCYSALDEVKANMARSRYPADHIRFIKGKVEDTLPEPSIDRIALLRLDTDWYESTRHELETLYDKLVTGGILIIDDYGHWSGARKAVDEFITARKLPLFLQRIDYTGRMAVKM